VFAIAVNLAILGMFKYGAPLGLGSPLGISFFTFTQVAFLVDAYRGDAKETIASSITRSSSPSSPT